MTIKLSQKLELKQEQVQLQLAQKLQLYLPPEFARYIDIEDDEDINLLRRSVAFLALHEFSHPLYNKRKVSIPAENLPENLPFNYRHNAIEVGIDKSAMLLGPQAGITPERMYVSHLAMMERIFRDHFELRKFPCELSLLARFYCEIKEHQKEAKDDILRKKMEKLLGQAEKEIIGLPGAGRFDEVAGLYSKVYQGTKLNF